MDLKELSDEDLSAFLEVFRALAMQKKNKVAMDLFAIVEREMLSRHESTPIAEYRDDELVAMIEILKAAVDSARANGARDDVPLMQFLLENLTVLIGEAEKRG
jgi:hypothetical protein